LLRLHLNYKFLPKVKKTFLILKNPSKKPYFQHVTGGVYKIKVQIHHSMLIYDYL
jgi:hypothetical protein